MKKIMQFMFMCMLIVPAYGDGFYNSERDEKSVRYVVASRGECLATWGTSAVFCDKVVHGVTTAGRTVFSFRSDDFAIVLSGGFDEETATEYYSEFDTVFIGSHNQKERMVGNGACHMVVTKRGERIVKISCEGVVNGKRFTLEFEGIGRVQYLQ
jgi:hypothetical protein